jgi:hypothetical protein
MKETPIAVNLRASRAKILLRFSERQPRITGTMPVPLSHRSPSALNTSPTA